MKLILALRVAFLTRAAAASVARSAQESSCDTAAGERWCESLQMCHNQWETACPTSASCVSDSDCRFHLGGCGPYACECVALGINEANPIECSPDNDPPCMCAGCTSDVCSDVAAMCIDGMCGLSTDKTKAIIDEYGCVTFDGEKWCESLQTCHKEWETACPTSASCTSDNDCRVWLGGCGPYICDCLALGIDEATPTECIKDGPPCACADCISDTCSDVTAMCIEGTCGLSTDITEDIIDENGCVTSDGEIWCASLNKCLLPWEEICPSSAPCTSNEECRVWLGGCGSYACECFALRIDESTPTQCSPINDPPCACAKCMSDICSNVTAMCIEGTCGLSTDKKREIIDGYGCVTSDGEKWCESLQMCHKEWETACPTSASCVSDSDCRFRLGGCGPYACECVPLGINEANPIECSPENDPPCMCAGCASDVCSDVTAMCIEGTCGLSTDDTDSTRSAGSNFLPSIASAIPGIFCAGTGISLMLRLLL
eukprot:CAMPEP_0197433600 /NCGR_PEP_ID=MMETSP1175-20131217/1452_1 /TAXON_ID=1003142 /ORGANISM="Triceratium dubium, Strain CCMP147" /LENGTH=487 /DNA_ID=CAMNT_0042962037 /DNA_START=72 /DNA_END=1535 /DNA_ORIENTATION=-